MQTKGEVGGGSGSQGKHTACECGQELSKLLASVFKMTISISLVNDFCRFCFPVHLQRESGKRPKLDTVYELIAYLLFKSLRKWSGQ